LAQADVLVVVGTSLQVYPAAGLIHYATNAQARFIIDPNADELDVPDTFTKIKAPASEGMQEFSNWFAQH